MNDLSRITDALTGAHGENQKRIAEQILKWGTTLLKKNKDYGSSAWKKPVLQPKLSAGDAILVRMSDKIERMQSLLLNGTAEIDESFEDTINDLGSYCLLWLARPKPGTMQRIGVAKPPTEDEGYEDHIIYTKTTPRRNAKPKIAEDSPS